MNLTIRDSLPSHFTRPTLLTTSPALDVLGGPSFRTFCPRLLFTIFLCAFRLYCFEEFPATKLGASVTELSTVITPRPRDAIHSDKLSKAELLLVNATMNAPSLMAEFPAKPTSSRFMLVDEL